MKILFHCSENRRKDIEAVNYSPPTIGECITLGERSGTVLSKALDEDDKNTLHVTVAWEEDDL